MYLLVLARPLSLCAVIKLDNKKQTNHNPWNYLKIIIIFVMSLFYKIAKDREWTDRLTAKLVRLHCQSRNCGNVSEAF